MLNIISFSNSLLKRSLLEKKDQSASTNLVFLNNIETGVEEISQLLDRVIFYVSLEANEIKIQSDPIDLNLFCNDIVSQMQTMGSNKKQTINFINNNNCKIACFDKTRLESVLRELLSNAITYSPENSTINLKLSFQEQKTLFTIQDRGIGIPQKDLPRIFEPLFRGSNKGDVKGSGMGLAIVKKLVEIQGGNIDVSSEIGIGTTFMVTLPSSDSSVSKITN